MGPQSKVPFCLFHCSRLGTGLCSVDLGQLPFLRIVKIAVADRSMFLVDSYVIYVVHEWNHTSKFQLVVQTK